MVYNGCMTSQYYLLSLQENSLERSEFAPKSVMINRGCSSAVLACARLERESLLLPAMMSLVDCYPLSDELGQCGELSMLHRFGLVSENECATKARGVQRFLLQKAGVYQREQPQHTLLPQEALVSGSESEHYAVIIAGIGAPNGMICP